MLRSKSPEVPNLRKDKASEQEDGICLLDCGIVVLERRVYSEKR